MSVPAGDLEDLGPPEGGAVARAGRRANPAALTVRARIGLILGLAIFTVGALVQILAAAWLALLTLLFGGAAEVLVHTGGLEPGTFSVSSVAAIVLDAVILLVIAISSVRRGMRRGSGMPERFAERHPVIAASAGLVLALGFVIACGWRPSPYFPYPLATVVVLANAYFFGLVGVFATARLFDVVWRQVKAWGAASEYRAGFLTASLLLIGAAGYWLLTTQWYAPPLRELRARIEAEDLGEVTSILSGELDGLCLMANELEPALAHSSAAPACGFLASGTRPLDDCFSGLMKNEVPKAKPRLRQAGLNGSDIDDAIMKAMLATCTRKPPPDDLAAYFSTVARNQARQMVQDARRTVSCDHLDDYPAVCPQSEDTERDAKLAKLWETAFCRLSASTAEIVRRRLEQDESFREIGQHLEITETKAKDTFHNAVKKLRALGLAGCASDWSE